MADEDKGTTLGQAIDTIMQALKSLEAASRVIAVRAVCDALKLPLTDTAGGSEPPRPPAGAFQAPPVQGGQPAFADIRSLKQAKQPGTAQEMAALVAFYLQQSAQGDDRKDTITREDLDKYFIQADYPLPMRMQQLLPDAKAAGYFDSVGGGSYKLNPVGYNLVAHGLPRKAGSPDFQKPKKSKPRNVAKKPTAKP